MKPKLEDLPNEEREIVKKCAEEAGVTEEEFFAVTLEFVQDAIDFHTFKFFKNLGKCSDLFH